MVNELLYKGKAHAIPGVELATLLHTDIHTLLTHISREQQQGKAICSTGQAFYLAANNGELLEYLQGCKDTSKMSAAHQKLRDVIIKLGCKNGEKQAIICK